MELHSLEEHPFVRKQMMDLACSEAELGLKLFE